MIKTFEFEKLFDLKYGENPHQQAVLYKYGNQIEKQLLKGGNLSYGNILNATVVLDVIAEFFDVACIAVAKNTNLLSAALGKDLDNAYEKALDSNPISFLNSTIAFSRIVEEPLAKKLADISIELIAAPDFTDGAVEILNKNKNLKLLKINTPLHKIPLSVSEEVKITPFGAIVQEKNTRDFNKETFKILTKKKPEQSQLEDMIFAFKVAKHVKSTAIVIAKDLRTLAVSGGEGNRTDSVEIAFSKVCDSTKDTILASDGAITTMDVIQIAAQNRAVGIIHPAGTAKDVQLAEYADKMNISITATGIRHLKY